MPRSGHIAGCPQCCPPALRAWGSDLGCLWMGSEPRMGLVPVDATQCQGSLGWGHQCHPPASIPGVWILLPAGIFTLIPSSLGSSKGPTRTLFFFLLQLHCQQPGSALRQHFPALSLLLLTFLVGRIFLSVANIFHNFLADPINAEEGGCELSLPASSLAPCMELGAGNCRICSN